MNIYINVEISSRELDSKLLLAVIAASKGHQVLISDMSGIDRGIRNKFFKPGIFHTKCISPYKEKIDFHDSLIQQGYVITSIDEESGLDIEGYDEFSKTRYSDKTIEQSSAVFAWGNDDMESLKKVYPKHISKIYKTGSPRIDLTKSSFLEYWKSPSTMPKRPFLLISSNMSKANYIKPFYQLIKDNKQIKLYDHIKESFKHHFSWAAEDYLKTHSFIEAIKYLAKSNNDYDIVFRPHPVENIESWKFYLEDIPNAHVIREGAVTSWINNCFALMHCGCTTAIEATVAGKPVVSYVPFKMNYSASFTNKLGYHVESLEKLSSTIDDIFNDRKSIDQKDLLKSSSEIFSKKIHLDKNELAAQKIVKLWESLDNQKLSKPSSWGVYHLFLKISNFKDKIGRYLRKIFPLRYLNFREDFKFPPLDKNNIFDKVNRLKNAIGVDKKLECKLLGKRTILIRRH